MGNCCHPFGLTKTISSKSRQKNIVLLLVGLDNAGKTTAAKNLIGEPVDSAVPTVGFSSVTLMHRGYSVVIYDLGGGPQIRGIWHRYFVDVHGIIFVVDASDVSRLEEGRSVLENLLLHAKLAGKPVLLLANKQDCEGALDELDIVERLNVETLVNQQRCPTLVEMCSATAIKNSRRQLDPAVQNGFRWLMNCIIRDYNNLNCRVESDVAVQRKQEEQEKKERLERIRRAREERGEDVIGGVTSNGTCNGGVHDDSDSDVIMANPFKPITDVMEKITSSPPELEQVLNNRIILVKESPKKFQHGNEEKQNHFDGGDSSTLNDMKTLMDIDGEEAVLVASTGSGESLKSGAGDKNWFGSPVNNKQLPSPTHSITELIKDQLEMKVVQHKKRPFLRRTNRTAPAPMGPSAFNHHTSLHEHNFCEPDTVNTQQEKIKPIALRKQAFVEETSISGEYLYNLQNKQSTDRASLFCVSTRSASSEHLNNYDSNKVKLEHKTHSADSKIRKRPHIGEIRPTSTRVQPVTIETSLSSSYIEENFQPPIESDQVIVLKQISSNSTSLPVNHKCPHERDSHVSAAPIKQWAIDEISFSSEGGDKLDNMYTSVAKEKLHSEGMSRGNSKLNSVQYGETRLIKQSSIDETSSVSSKSRAGSQHLSDSGFVSPKNVLPPIRPTSSVDKPPWILPTLSSQVKHSSQDSVFNINKHDAGKCDASHDSNLEANNEMESTNRAET